MPDFNPLPTNMGNQLFLATRQTPETDKYQMALLEYLQTKTLLPTLIETDGVGFGRRREANHDDQQFVLIKGDVQSGKSEVLAMIAIYLTIVRGENVVLVFRNINADYEQFASKMQKIFQDFKNFAEFDCDIADDNDDVFDRWPRLFFTNSPLDEVQPRPVAGGRYVVGNFVMALMQQNHLDKACDALLDEATGERLSPFNVLIDEVDQNLYSQGTICSQKLDALVDVASTITGVTATAWDVMADHRFSCSSTYILPRPPTYKSIEDLKIVYIRNKSKNVRTKNTDANIATPLQRDPDLRSILAIYAESKGFPSIRMKPMGLLKVESTKAGQIMLAADIHREFPNCFATLIYNSESISVYHPSIAQRIQRLVQSFPDDKWLNRLRPKISANGHVVFTRKSIRHVLQFFKDHAWGFRILIISDLICSRGLNIVSDDYQWHLTFEVLRISKTTRISNMMQDLRILGCFKDDMPLTLYCEKEVHHQLMVESKALNEMLVRAKNMASLNQALPLSEAIERMDMDIRKTTSRKQLRTGGRLSVNVVRPMNANGACADGGDAIEGYLSRTHPAQRIASNGAVEDIPVAVATPIPVASAATATEEEYPPMDPKELERLTQHSLKRWFHPSNQTGIAQLVQSIGFHDDYGTINDFKAECQKFGVTVTHVMTPYKKNGWSFGQLFIMSGTKVTLHPLIRDDFKRHVSE